MLKGRPHPDTILGHQLPNIMKNITWNLFFKILIRFRAASTAAGILFSQSWTRSIAVTNLNQQKYKPTRPRTSNVQTHQSMHRTLVLLMIQVGDRKWPVGEYEVTCKCRVCCGWQIERNFVKRISGYHFHDIMQLLTPTCNLGSASL